MIFVEYNLFKLGIQVYQLILYKASLFFFLKKKPFLLMCITLIQIVYKLINYYTRLIRMTGNEKHLN